MILRIIHKSSEPSWEGKDDSIDIDKDDFPSEQANGDTEEAPEVQTIAGASELTGPARKLSENRKEPVQSAITVPQEDRRFPKPCFFRVLR